MSNPTLKELLRCETEKIILIDMAERCGLGDSRTLVQNAKIDRLVNKVMGKRLANYDYIGVTGKKLRNTVMVDKKPLDSPGRQCAVKERGW